LNAAAASALSITTKSSSCRLRLDAEKFAAPVRSNRAKIMQRICHEVLNELGIRFRQFLVKHIKDQAARILRSFIQPYQPSPKWQSNDRKIRAQWWDAPQASIPITVGASALKKATISLRRSTCRAG
jgi:hypothetical protein